MGVLEMERVSACSCLARSFANWALVKLVDWLKNWELWPVRITVESTLAMVGSVSLVGNLEYRYGRKKEQKWNG